MGALRRAPPAPTRRCVPSPPTIHHTHRTNTSPRTTDHLHEGRRPSDPDAHRAHVASSAARDEYRRLLAPVSALGEGGDDEGEGDGLEGLEEGPGKRLRRMALAEAKLRKQAFERSKKAFRAGRKAEAKQVRLGGSFLVVMFFLFLRAPS